MEPEGLPELVIEDLDVELEGGTSDGEASDTRTPGPGWVYFDM
jgi:hypothetical protein